MTNPLKHVQELGSFSEAYEVVRTVVVVLDGHTYRIDVLKGYVPATTRYTARCSVPRQVPAQVIAAATPSTDGSIDALTDGTVAAWVEYPFIPPVEAGRPKEALADALGRLAGQPSLTTAQPASPPRPRRRAPVVSSSRRL
jgi:hypothetical protein